MKVGDVFSYAFGAIRLRKLRSGLTTLGIVIGIAAIVALLSIGQGLQDTITLQLQKGFATDTLIASTGGGFGAGGGLGGAGSGFSLFVNDTLTINKIDGVVASVAVIQRVGFLKYGSTSSPHNVVGVNFTEYADIYGSTFVAENGAIPLKPGNETVVIGNRVADPGENGTLFFHINDAFQFNWINSERPPRNVTYSGTVAAVLKEIGGFSFGGPSDSNVYIPISRAQEFFGTNECEMIIVRLKDDAKTTIDSVSAAIKQALSNEVSVTSSTAVLSIISSIFSTLELFLAGIAAISLVVAGIGIMNIMIVALMERTREIGILKALGMKSSTVLSIFLCEAMIVGLLGGAIGTGLGWVLANVVARVFSSGRFGFGGNQGAATGGLSINPVLTPTVLVGAIVFGLVVSVVFAIYPAWRASKLKPVDALRYE